MRNTQIIKKVLQAFPEYKSYKNYIFEREYEHILSGFCIERLGSGLHINRFVFPLYDSYEDLTLLYSYRLESECYYISFESILKKGIESTVISKLETAMKEYPSVKTVDKFAEEVKNKKGLLLHEHAQMIYGFTLVLLNKCSEGIVYLEKASYSLRSHYSKVCQKVIAEAKSDIEKAQKTILSYELEMKERMSF